MFVYLKKLLWLFVWCLLLVPASDSPYTKKYKPLWNEIKANKQIIMEPTSRNK